MKRIIQRVTDRPRTVIGVILLLTVLAGVALVRPGLRMNADPYILNTDHPSMVALEHLREAFTGTLETALVLLREPEGIINADSLRRIGRLTTAFETMTLVQPGQAGKLARLGRGLTGEPRALLDALLADGLTGGDAELVLDLQGALDPEDPALGPLLDGLDETLLMLQPVKEVTSLANVENITARGDELVVDTLYEEVPATSPALARVARAALENELFRKVLLSPDGTSTGIIVETYIPRVRSDLMTQAHQRMLALLEEIPGAEEAHVAGMPIMAATSVSIMQRDNKMFFPLVFAIVLGALAITFRGAAGVLLPISVVLISVIWTLGVMALLDVPLNIITTTLPVFLITIGVADGIHLLTEFRDHRRRGKPPREAAVATMRQMALPVVMTSITTSVGFFTLAYTHIRYIQHFGVFVGIGVLAAMVFSLTFIPAVLALGRDRPVAPAAAAGGGGGRPAGLDAAVPRALTWVSRMAVRRRGRLLAGALVVMAVSVFGLLRVQVENNFVEYFRQDIPVVRAAHALNEHLAGSSVVNMLVTAPESEPDPFKSPRYLAAVAELQRHIEQNPIVGRTMGLTDVLQRLNLVLHQNDPAYNRLPREQETVTTRDGARRVDGRNLVAQYLLLYENGGGANLSDYTDSTYRTLNVQIQLNTISSRQIAALIDETEAYAKAHLPAGLTMRFVGPAEAATTVNEEVVRTQVTSLVMSLAVVFLLLLVQFRSLSKGLLAIVPLVFTVLVNFGMMGLTGIPLNLGTAIISSVVIGIGVDFAIHYLSRLQTELDRGMAPGDAFAATMLASGKAITANAVTVAVGFLALSFSNMVPIRQVGWMVSQTLVLSAVSTLVLIPAAASFFRVGFLRQAESSPKLSPGLASATAVDR